MRKFDYSAFPGALLTPEISNLLSAIHEYRGKQDLCAVPQKLDSLTRCKTALY